LLWLAFIVAAVKWLFFSEMQQQFAEISLLKMQTKDFSLKSLYYTGPNCDLNLIDE
jgi:hypothetical protein